MSDGMPVIERARCVLCGYCADEDLREPPGDVRDTGRRDYKRCEVCRAPTTHRIEEVRHAR
jgi:hypothetical protein